MKTSSVAVLAAVVLACRPATAGADAIAITDGGLVVSPFGRFLDGFETKLVSDNVTVRVFGLTGKPLNDPCVTSPCLPGEVRNFSSSVDAFDVLSFGTTLNGRSQDHVWVSMHLALTTGDVAITDMTPVYMGVVLPPQPFTMSGRLTLRTGDLTTGLPGATILDTLVTGQGTFQAYLAGAQGGAKPPFSFSGSGFDFGPATPAPTPEPATLLMVASGLAVVRRRTSRRSDFPLVHWPARGRFRSDAPSRLVPEDSLSYRVLIRIGTTAGSGFYLTTAESTDWFCTRKSRALRCSVSRFELSASCPLNGAAAGERVAP